MDTTLNPTVPARDTVAVLVLMASVVALPLFFALAGRMAHAQPAPMLDTTTVAELG